MSSCFTASLYLRAWSAAQLSLLDDRRQKYELTAPLSYFSALAGVIVVPAGFVTDFASIPRAAWSLLDPEDPVILFASVVHDYLYSAGESAGTREQADAVLIEAMAVCGASAWQRQIVYHAVRWFGASHWSK